MAHPVHRMVLDISHHNTVTDWQAVRNAGIVGIIHKASEGTYMTDDDYKDRRREAGAAGLLWGAYHFATDDNVAGQVDLFIRMADPTKADLICLDWEPYGSNTMSAAQVREFVELVEERLGRPGECVIYSGNQAKEQLHANDHWAGERRLWLAHYSSSPTCEPPWDHFWLWQYSDGNAGPGPQGCPGVTGDVDTNSFDGTPAELRAQWAGGIGGIEQPDADEV